MAETYSRRPQRRHPIEFKRRVAEDFLSGEYSLNSLSNHYDVARVSIRHWASQYQRGELDDITADTVDDLFGQIRRWERVAGQQALLIDTLRRQLAAHGIPEQMEA